MGVRAAAVKTMVQIRGPARRSELFRRFANAPPRAPVATGRLVSMLSFTRQKTLWAVLSCPVLSNHLGRSKTALQPPSPIRARRSACLVSREKASDDPRGRGGNNALVVVCRFAH